MAKVSSFATTLVSICNVLTDWRAFFHGMLGIAKPTVQYCYHSLHKYLSMRFVDAAADIC